MINLGFYSGQNMPSVSIGLTVVDRILEGAAILIGVATWVLAVMFYFRLPVAPQLLFVAPAAITLCTAAFLWASRAPIRFYNFAVKLTENNYIMQLFLARRCVRAINVIANSMLLCTLLMEVEHTFDTVPGLFELLVYVFCGLLLIALIVYYIFAFRYK